MSVFEPGPSSGGGGGWGSGGSGGRVPSSPQMARRVAILGGIAVALFAIAFFRLWFLQVLSGDQYVQQARANRVRLVSVTAPRGEILDRNGTALVENQSGTVIQIEPAKLPIAERTAAAVWGQDSTQRLTRSNPQHGVAVPIPPVPDMALSKEFRRLATVLSTSAASIQRQVIQQLAQVPYAPVRLRTGVPNSIRDYLSEYENRFPGVSVRQVYLRRYPQGELAAQILGTIGQISPAELKYSRFKGVPRDSVVGQEGLESEYDRYLRGVEGATRISVNAEGRPIGTRLQRSPVPGRSVSLSLDLGLQRAGQAALAKVLTPPANAGAFVAMDPRNGQILAMGSAPTFDPKILSKPITTARYKALFGDAAGAPRFNRAIAGSYPTGSTFKPITAMAGLASKIITPGTVVDDTGCIAIGGNHKKFCNAGKVANGPVDLRNALRVSSDIYFYTVGRDANPLPGQVIQTWARKLGLASPTGIDLPGEFGGLIPDAAWRARQNKREVAYEKRHHNVCPTNCVFSDKRAWSVGDNVNLAVGQGDVQATPLQMAVAYATLANGGTVVRPHLGLNVQDDQGRIVQRLPAAGGRKISIDPAYRQPILDGLHAAASESGGTSADVFGGWPQSQYPVYGKTGTAQRGLRPDQSWYVAFVNDPTRPIVVATTIEDGGFGADTAAPATCEILKHWYHTKASCQAGASKTQ